MVSDKILAGYFTRIQKLATQVTQDEPRCVCACCKVLRKIAAEAAKGLKRVEP